MIKHAASSHVAMAAAAAVARLCDIVGDRKRSPKTVWRTTRSSTKTMTLCGILFQARCWLTYRDFIK